MIKKTLIIIVTTIALTLNVNAASDGDLLLKKNEPAEIKDCFEKINRATFAFNQALDGIVFKPIASAYRVMPSPIRTGVSNSLDNLSSLVTIPNNSTFLGKNPNLSLISFIKSSSFCKEFKLASLW